MALDFDGVDDKVSHGDITGIDGASALTISAWVFLSAAGANKMVIAKDITATGVGLRWRLDGVGSKYVFHVSGTGVFGTTPNAITTGQWDHWALVFDGSGGGNSTRMICYLNGVQQTLAFTGTIEATIADSGTEPVEVGQSNSGGNGSAIDANIAHLKIWTAVLTNAEVLQEMNSYRPSKTANLILWSPYDDGTSARDYSGAANHGTVTGALQFQGPPVSYGG